MSVQQMLSQCNTSPNYVPPISMYRLGKRAFANGLDLSDCITPEMRRGWNDAFDAAMAAEFNNGGLSSALAFAGVVA